MASGLLKGSCRSLAVIYAEGDAGGDCHWSDVEPAVGLRNSRGQSANQPGGVQGGFLQRGPSRRQEGYLASREAEPKGEQPL